MTEIDELVNQLQVNLVPEVQLNLNNLNSTMTTRPGQDINYQLLRLHIDIIPTYYGDTHTLGIFIESCESLIREFGNKSTSLDTFLLRAIIGKLTGRALTLIGSRIELQTWTEIKEVLNLCFGDQRNIDCLVQDLISLCPYKNETPYNFGIRCQDARSLVISKINQSTLSGAEKIIHLQNYDHLALKTFIRGLNGQLQNNVRLRNPDSLEKAMSLVLEEENFLYSQQRLSTLNSQQFKINQRVTPTIKNPIKPFPSTPQRPIFIPNPIFQNNLPRPIYQPSFQNNFPRPNTNFSNNFPRPNFNFQNNHIRPPSFFQNQNQNFKPAQNTQTYRQPIQFNSQNKPNIDKPEPMDTSSGNTRRTNFQKPKFLATELYNFENTETDNNDTKINSNENFYQLSTDINNPNTDYYYDYLSENINPITYHDYTTDDFSTDQAYYYDTQPTEPDLVNDNDPNVNFRLSQQSKETT